MASVLDTVKAFFPEYGAWQKGQFQDWLSQMQYWRGQGNDLYSNLLGIAQNYQPPSVTDIMDYGRAINNPQPTIDAINSRWNELNAGRLGMTPASTSYSNIESILNGIDPNIARTYSNIGGLYEGAVSDIGGTSGNAAAGIDDAYKRALERDSNYSGAVMDTIGRAYDSATGNVTSAYGDTMSNMQKTYGDLLGQTGETYDKILKSLDLMNPSSQAYQAQVARSFAPQMVSTMERLKQGGIDPTSPQAQNAIRQVETARSRAMQDASASGNTAYLDRLSQALLGKQGDTTALSTSLADLMSELRLGGADALNSLGLNRSQAETGELSRLAQSQNSLDLSRAGTAGDIANSALNQRLSLLPGEVANEADARDQFNANALNKANLENQRRTFEQQDFSNLSNVLGQDVQNQLLGYNLNNDVFNRGMQYSNTNQNLLQQNYGNLANLMQTMFGNAFQGANAANAAGNQAMNAYGTSLPIESADKGGLMKTILGGITGAIPGISSISNLLGTSFGGNGSQAMNLPVSGLATNYQWMPGYSWQP